MSIRTSPLPNDDFTNGTRLDGRKTWKLVDATRETQLNSQSQAVWTVTGRTHLASALDEEIRLGRHHLLLDLSEVVFLSSAGIGALVKSYNDLDSIQGSLSIWKASERVRNVIEICGLDQMLLAKEDILQVDKRVQSSTSSLVRHVERAEASFDVYALAAEAGLTCRILGDATLIEGCRFSKENCYSMNFPDSSFAIGLGALGENFDECRSRFGEFIAVAGAVAYQPTDGTNVPDHLVTAGKSLSHVQVCYGIACEELSAGPFSMLLRFQAGQGGPVSLTELVDSCLEIAEFPRLGIVMVAEAAGLVGASLRRSPAQAKEEPGPFEFPQVREWLSFTAERTHTRSMTLVAGVALRDEAAVMAPCSETFELFSAKLGRFHQWSLSCCCLFLSPLTKWKD